MTGHTQSTDELKAHLEEQLAFLRASADAYDNGFEGEAKRIAVSIRVLVHDTGRAKSLLGQLGQKGVPFVDTSFPPVAQNENTHCGLIVTTLVPEAGAKYVAFLDNRPGGEAISKDFVDWWGTTVFVDSQRRELSRKDLVLSVADQDGGAHVDPALDGPYADLSRNNSLGWMYSDGGASVAMGGPEKAALRQICHEVLKTLVPGYAKAPIFPAGGMVIGQTVMLRGEAAMAQARQVFRGENIGRTEKIGRNEPCPCGSGIKFKRCCGAVA